MTPLVFYIGQWRVFDFVISLFFFSLSFASYSPTLLFLVFFVCFCRFFRYTNAAGLTGLSL